MCAHTRLFSTTHRWHSTAQIGSAGNIAGLPGARGRRPVAGLGIDRLKGDGEPIARRHFIPQASLNAPFARRFRQLEECARGHGSRLQDSGVMAAGATSQRLKIAESFNRQR
jgi:hypothetical protein